MDYEYHLMQILFTQIFILTIVIHEYLDAKRLHNWLLNR